MVTGNWGMIRESQVKLTKQTVDKAAARGGRYIVWDTDLKGFGLRVSERGTKTYVLRYRPRGLGSAAPKRFMVLGRHGVIAPDQARTHAKTILGEVAAGNDPAVDSRRKGLTARSLSECFLNDHVQAKRKSKTAIEYRALLNNHFIPRFGKRLAEGVTRSELSALHVSLVDRPYLANRLVAVVGSMYGFAERRGLVLKGSNPAKGVDRFREHSRERFLGPDELKRLGESLLLAETSGLPWTVSTVTGNKHLPPKENQRTTFPSEIILAFRLLLFTGARVGEILGLQWQHIDMDRGLIFLPDSKTGRKTIILNAPALELLKDAPRTGRYVVPGANPDRRRTDLKRPWDAIQRQAALEGVRLHDLRHTFASIGAGASLGLPIVGKLLGHSQPATTARYAHLHADPLRRASNIIGEHLAGALSSRRQTSDAEPAARESNSSGARP
jgi:integrase